MNSYTIFARNNWDRYFTRDVVNFIQQRGGAADVQAKEKFATRHTGTDAAAFAQALRHSNSIAVRNDATHEFFLISHIDTWEVSKLHDVLRLEPCVGLLKCQYLPGAYGEFSSKVAPFTYRVRDSWTYDELRDDLRQRVRANQRQREDGCGLFFKGNTIYRRAPVLKLLAGTINDEHSSRSGQAVQLEEYMQAMADCQVALSLPGNGNFCHRELEAFGIGVPVLQPVLQNTYYRPLLPDVHYLAVHQTLDHPQALATEIQETYQACADQQSRLQEVAAKALDWFEQNICFPANMELMAEVLQSRFHYEL